MITLFELLNGDPAEVRTVYDKGGIPKYQYIPVSEIQNRLDFIFNCNWSFDLDREVFGKRAVSAKGTLTVNFNNEIIITRAGAAAMPYSGDEIKLDYPSLKSHVLMNAAKSLGKVFGRDLNKEVDDKLEDSPDTGDPEYDMIKELLVNESEYDAAMKMLLDSAFKYVPELKEIVTQKINYKNGKGKGFRTGYR